MQIFTGKDYKIFERLVSFSQKEMHTAMSKFLRKYYKDVIITEDYIVAIGDIPIALVSHMDTVYDTPVSTLYYDQKKKVLWSPDGLGADDRAGIFAIMKIIQCGLRPSVIFTTDEEKGGAGAGALAQISCPIPGLKYMIELDRQGVDDCVFYDCFNADFYSYVESFGFQHQWGSFSDISFLMGTWDICGVNLSIGYLNEHSYAETLHIEPLYATIEKVKEMLRQKDIPDFEYDELKLGGAASFWKRNFKSGITLCEKCKTMCSEYETYPLKTITGDYILACGECLGEACWCDCCGEAYERYAPVGESEMLCLSCAEKFQEAVCIQK